MKTITLFGSTGMLGKPVTHALVQAGIKVKALVRNPKKAKEVLPDEVELIQGDLRNKKDIRTALAGADAAYISLSVAQSSRKSSFQPEREGIQNILSIAQEVKLLQIGYLSSVVHWYQGMNGFDWWAFRIKKQAVELIKDSGISHLIFYPSTFMETIPELFIQGNLIVLAGTPLHKNYFVAAEDYANQVVQAFKNVGPGNSKEYVVQGLEGFTNDEAAAVYAEHVPRPLSIIKAPLGIMKIAGYLVPQADYGAKIMESLNKYPETFQAELTWKELGKPKVTLAKFAAKKMKQ